MRAVPAVDPPAVVHARALRLRRGHAARSARTAARARWRCRSTRGSSARTRSASSRRSARRSVRLSRSRADRSARGRRAPRMIFLGFGKYVRADRIYALEPLVDERGSRRTHARLGRRDRRADRRLAHRARDPGRDGRRARPDASRPAGREPLLAGGAPASPDRRRAADPRAAARQPSVPGADGARPRRSRRALHDRGHRGLDHPARPRLRHPRRDGDRRHDQPLQRHADGPR